MVLINPAKNRVTFYTDSNYHALEDGIRILLKTPDFSSEFGALDIKHQAEPAFLFHDVVIAAVGVPSRADYAKDIASLLNNWQATAEKPMLLISSLDTQATQKAIDLWKETHCLTYSGTVDSHIQVIDQKMLTNKENLMCQLRGCLMYLDLQKPSVQISDAQIASLAPGKLELVQR